jgi:uncharacterized protein YndB with AHSA1/START domain
MTERNDGLARVSIKTSVPVEAAFDALVRADQLTSWLGTPTVPLRAGGATRIEFGDGDFFAIDHIAITRPTRVRYTWRFLGLGSENRITWTVAARGAQTVVTVSDEQPERDDREVEHMREGWSDFLDRLARYLASGVRTRYDWRREIEASVELACSTDEAAARLFAPDALDRWQPWRAGAWQAGANLQVVDGRDPAELQLVELARGANELHLAVAAPHWRHPTHCELKLAPRRAGAMLTMSHTGWDQTADSDEGQHYQRERFCGLWIESLTRAQALGGQP